MILNNPTFTLVGFLVVIVLLFFLIAKVKWHVFMALLIPIILFALIPGVDQGAFIKAFESGFGKTVQSIAVVIVLGSVIAEALKETGGIEKITLKMIDWVGQKRMPLALTLTGFVIGIAIFSDVGYVILNPLVHSAAIASGVNMSVMSTGLVGAMQLTHAMVPPTPGPLAAAALLKADVGKIIIYGSLATFIGSLAGWLFALIAGPRIPSPPSQEFVGQSFADKGLKLPSTIAAYAPIMVPLILIAGQSFANLYLPSGLFKTYVNFIGWPPVALLIGIWLAYRNTNADQKKIQNSKWIEEALRTSAMIIMVTGLGGSLSAILKGTPAVDYIANAIVQSGVPSIFLPFVLGIVGNIITGSTTVGVITAASIAAPMLGTLGLSPEAAMLAGGAGSVIIKYVNSSYFWVCTSLSRMELKSALYSYGGVTLVGGVASMAAVYVMWLVHLI
ncbi:H+/gluconate symporter family protein [Desulfosporosinus orientis DSM 765]|uniref:H+/gluconate symporter family protein n=1 Tax=Desulfosporosinus orientis (strain ATCC 19365 / DSM 765 / NCIMB 8382 / VKM B-1628 / Singapore I) TaxID=768706 RepID=G7WC19_DESOD|nr:SLC13 family permease [Desulfosporosinus orientis]AET69993.1 H+/gluconate symporter family protein [Desulfosporosinus orientis DSM 765]